MGEDKTQEALDALADFARLIAICAFPTAIVLIFILAMRAGEL